MAGEQDTGMPASPPIALVTGANRGLGFETARQLGRLEHRVLLTSRDGIKGKAATEKLQSEGLDVVYHPLDVDREDSRNRLFRFIRERFGRLDVLVNNAGIMPEGQPEQAQQASVLETGLEPVRACMETHLYGPLRLCQEAVPLMRRNGYGRIVNISTALAQLAEMRGGFAGYRFSKVALNAMTRAIAAEVRGDNILVNAVNPGWVRTRMGGGQAQRSPAEAVRGITWLATLDESGPNGGFYQDRMAINW